MKKTIISVFIVLNLATVVLMNRADPQISKLGGRTLKTLSPQTTYKMAWGAWGIEYYAYLTGLDSRWTMYGQLPKYNAWYRFIGKYANSESVILPIPFQSETSFRQRTFFDFKEGKFYKNIYSDPIAQEAYARYLARKYPLHEGSRLQYIIWEIYGQGLSSPTQARATGISVLPATGRIVQQVYQFPAAWFDH